MAPNRENKMVIEAPSRRVSEIAMYAKRARNGKPVYSRQYILTYLAVLPERSSPLQIAELSKNICEAAISVLSSLSNASAMSFHYLFLAVRSGFQSQQT